MNALNRLRAFTACELLNESFPEREDVIEPWLRTEETAVIWAASGVGKTFLSLSIALAVAGGGSVGPWTAPKARRVLLVDGEMHSADLQDRIRFLLNSGAVKVPNRDLALRNLRIIARQAQKVGTGFFDMCEDDDQKGLLAMVQGTAELVILDNLTTLSEGLEDENDATKFKPLQAFFMELKRAKVATILVHHSNKSGRDMRGSTALETTFEVILGLRRLDLVAHDGAAFVAEFTKFRGKRDRRTEPQAWKLKDGAWETAEAEPESAKDYPAVKALRTGDYATHAEIARAIGKDRSTVTRQLKAAKIAKALTDRTISELFELAREKRNGRPVFETDDLEPASQEEW